MLLMPAYERFIQRTAGCAFLQSHSAHGSVCAASRVCFTSNRLAAGVCNATNKRAAASTWLCVTLSLTAAVSPPAAAAVSLYALQETGRQTAATLRKMQARLAENPLAKVNAKLVTSNIDKDEHITKLNDRANKLVAENEVRGCACACW
jgi:hypothetical protein